MLRSNNVLRKLRRHLQYTQLRYFADKLPDYKTTVNVADIKVRIDLEG